MGKLDGTWEERRARLEKWSRHPVGMVRLDMVADDICAALERDKQYELLRAAVNDTGPCTDDQHGDECACNADVMLRKLRQRVEELEREVEKMEPWGRGLTARAEAAEAGLARVVEALKICSSLFHAIRMDWTDPRDDCRAGQECIEAALAAARGE